MSRYIADRIFEEEYEDILPSFYTGLAISELLGAIVGIPFAIRLVMVGKVEIMDNDGKLVMEKDVTVIKNIEKANYFDYFKKNLKTITYGF